VSSAQLSIYDARGRLVRTLKSGGDWPLAGALVWDGRDERGGEASSGTYFAVLKAGAQRSSQKLSLIR